ncbi:bifunctional DedA family/phosphatase PAP2 family protein [Litoribrevibacter albus]|uniref:Phosphatidic acid phosphatase type 2/haloperoxidase domain-containing protein n=1 Tax=Litoribrevibacter albus TaxID=1473156 RepID=A0AA37SBT7_9GAMM|nr:bifunctional DedA family/phosphatase PAP2 family protein [Litoribrevibacter albus]GLQ32461.1 hypothetical protein GCM10007876_29400 [Litoribrevibacter albus]
MSFDSILDWLNLNPEWFLLGVFLTAFSESLAIIGLIMPGAFLMFALMVMAGNQDFSLQAVLIWSFFGAVLGDAVSFYFGRTFKDRIPSFWPFNRNPQWLQQGQSFFDQHGGKSIFVGRFVGPVRPIIPMIAGMLAMPSGKFLAVNIISAVGWAICYVIPGYIIGAAMRLNISLPENFKTVFFTTIILLCGFIALAVWVYQNLHPDRSIYRYMKKLFTSNDTLESIWHKLSAPRQDDPSFPLPSLLTLLTCLTLFLGWVFWVDYASHPLFTDTTLLSLAKQLHSESAQTWLVALTMLGDPNLLYFCAGLFSLYLVIKRQYSVIILIAAVTGLSYVLVTVLKEAFELTRPEVLVTPFPGHSFPSGHTVGATVYFGLIASFMAQEVVTHRRWPLYLGAVILAFLVGISRVLLGVHWFSDVICGLLLGALIVSLARLIYSPFNQHSLTMKRYDLWLPIALAAGYAGYYWLEFENQLQRYIWLDFVTS